MFQNQGAPMTHGRFIIRGAKRQAFAIVATALGTIGGSRVLRSKESLPWRRTVRGTATSESAASLKARRWAKSTGRNAVARLANLWIRRKPGSSCRFAGKRATDSSSMMLPVITSIKPELRSKGYTPLLLARRLSVLGFVGRDHRVRRE